MTEIKLTFQKPISDQHSWAKLVLVFCYSVTPIIETNLASLKIGFSFLAPIAGQIPEFQRSEIITALAAIITVFLYILQYTW